MQKEWQNINTSYPICIKGVIVSIHQTNNTQFKLIPSDSITIKIDKVTQGIVKKVIEKSKPKANTSILKHDKLKNTQHKLISDLTTIKADNITQKAVQKVVDKKRKNISQDNSKKTTDLSSNSDSSTTYNQWYLLAMGTLIFLVIAFIIYPVERKPGHDSQNNDIVDIKNNSRKQDLPLSMRNNLNYLYASSNDKNELIDTISKQAVQLLDKSYNQLQKIDAANDSYISYESLNAEFPDNETLKVLLSRKNHYKSELENILEEFTDHLTSLHRHLQDYKNICKKIHWLSEGHPELKDNAIVSCEQDEYTFINIEDTCKNGHSLVETLKTLLASGDTYTTSAYSVVSNIFSTKGDKCG